MWGACRLRQFWRFNLILTHCGFLGRASAKQSEISEHSEHSEGLADARTMVCRSWLTAYPPWRRWGVVWSGTACHRLRGGNYICVLGAPGMSPTPRSAKYPATHSCHRLPGWRKCPPFVIIIAFCHRLRRRRRAGATCFDGAYRLFYFSCLDSGGSISYLLAWAFAY